MMRPIPSSFFGEEEPCTKKARVSSKVCLSPPPAVISYVEEENEANLSSGDSDLSINSCETIETSSPIPLTGDEEECVSFLMTLKFRETNVEDVQKLEKQSTDFGPVCPLGLPSDSVILSPLQSYIRSNCIQVFCATKDDIKPTSSRLRARISMNRVGVRCAFCHHVSTPRASQSVSFPTKISGIYSAVVMIQSRHFKLCAKIPAEVRARIEELKKTGRTNKGEGNKRQDYWKESAENLGLVDTNDGIRFKGFQEKVDFFSHHKPLKTNPIPQVICPSLAREQREESLVNFLGNSELLNPEDADLVPPYLFLAIAQMKVCRLSQEDRIGCYKDRRIGFKGMCCMHCGGAPGHGKYFPGTMRSLAQTTTSQTIIKHVGSKCAKCPDHIKNILNKLLEEGLAEGGNYGRGGKDVIDGKPKYGSRKIFFQRLWARIHGEKVPPVPGENYLNTRQGHDDKYERRPFKEAGHNR